MSDTQDQSLLKVDNEYAKETCKVGKNGECCRYLGAGGDGWSCLKLTEMKSYLDARVAMGTMNAKGDNCPGRSS